MYDIIVSEKNAKDKIFSVNSNELTVVTHGGKPEILCKNVSSDFDVVAENGGAVSVMIVSLNGSLIYLRYVLGEWKKYTVLDSRGGGKRINGVKLVKLNGRIHAFYCIEYERRMMLVHHISEGNEFVREPYVIDYISLRCSYDVCVDDSMNIHIVYADEDSHIKYVTFSNSQKNYLSSEVGCDDEIRSVNCVFCGGFLYAAYLSRERDYNVINCIKIAEGEKHTVGFGVDALSEPCIFSSGGEICIEWCEKGYAFECSADKNFRFSKPFSLGRSDGILKIRSFENEAVSVIDKCAGNMSKKPFSSAKAVFEKTLVKEKRKFEIKGSEAERYAKSCLAEDEVESDALEIRIAAVEEQMKSLVKTVMMLSEDITSATHKSAMHDVGEIDKENFEKFNSINPDDFNVTNSDDTEYTEIKEES